jgi:hypothetical protein
LSADLESGVLGPLSPGARGTANTGAARCPGGGGGAGTPCHGIWLFSLQLFDACGLEVAGCGRRHTNQSQLKTADCGKRTVWS